MKVIHQNNNYNTNVYSNFKQTYIYIYHEQYYENKLTRYYGTFLFSKILIKNNHYDKTYIRKIN